MPQIFEIIKCDENLENRLIWKHPSEDFNTKSVLIVSPAQAAVLFYNGEAKKFEHGQYRLDTGNIPFLRRVPETVLYGGQSSHHCQIFFVNKSIHMGLGWGTKPPFPIRDAELGVGLRVRSNGQMGIRIIDAESFVINWASTNIDLTTNSFENNFRATVTSRVIAYISCVMKEVSFYCLSQMLMDMSNAIQVALDTDFKPFGIQIVTFSIESITLDDDNLKKVEEVLYEKYRQNELGYNWTDDVIATVLKNYAANPGSQNNVGGMIAQTPLALAFGQMFSQNMAPFIGTAISQFSQPPRAFAAYANNQGMNTQEKNMFPGRMAPLQPKNGDKSVKDKQKSTQDNNIGTDDIKLQAALDYLLELMEKGEISNDVYEKTITSIKAIYER